tara:strand:- start:305 stop:496 length:192 start_codon:yes stop_codon:yes gene_type:complete
VLSREKLNFDLRVCRIFSCVLFFIQQPIKDGSSSNGSNSLNGSNADAAVAALASPETKKTNNK